MTLLSLFLPANCFAQIRSPIASDPRRTIGTYRGPDVSAALQRAEKTKIEGKVQWFERQEEGKSLTDNESLMGYDKRRGSGDLTDVARSEGLNRTERTGDGIGTGASSGFSGRNVSRGKRRGMPRGQTRGGKPRGINRY